MPIPEFIQALRAKIGTDLLHIPTVAVLVYDEQGRILLVQHMESKLWGIPGGIVDPHELPADAAVRETWEEAGVFVELEAILGVFAGEHFCCTFDNGDQLAVVETLFSARVVSGTPRPDGVETADVRFVYRDELDRLSLAADVRVVLQAVSKAGSTPYFKPATWRPTPT